MRNDTLTYDVVVLGSAEHALGEEGAGGAEGLKEVLNQVSEVSRLNTQRMQIKALALDLTGL